MASQQTISIPTQNPHQQPSSTTTTTILQNLRKNISFKSKWPSELNGAMGDLGTYIPIILALTLSTNLNLGTTLIFTGFYNILTGAIYGVPMPVQPMKSIAAVAISTSDFGVPEIMAAGICTGGALLVLGATGLMKLMYRIIPLCVVRGIQLSQGLAFAFTAVKYIRNLQNFSKPKSGIGERGWLGFDGLILAISCACFIIIVNGAAEKQDQQEQQEEGIEERKRGIFMIGLIPCAFIVFVLGVILGFIRNPKIVAQFKLGPSPIQVVKISKQAWKKGFIKGTIPQLPLSVLNSVIAVCKLSSDLFPGKEFSAGSVSGTVGVMNLVGCWFGAMPCCHGAGGLAGQYKFGGRSGGCVVMLGMAKLGLGLVLGSSIVAMLQEFPVGVLGVLLLFAGIELAIAARDVSGKEDAFVMLVCCAVSLVGSSAALGFLCGMVVHLLLKLRNYLGVS
ncbi:Molybdate transporter 1 [Linum perenne]